MLEFMVEIFLLALGVIIGILAFYMTRLYNTVDRQGDQIVEVSKDLTDHRVEDAAKMVSRQELDTRLHDLRDDIRGMMQPIRQELQSIGNFLREQRK